MNTEDMDVKKALDDIFNEDILEIDATTNDGEVSDNLKIEDSGLDGVMETKNAENENNNENIVDEEKSSITDSDDNNIPEESINTLNEDINADSEASSNKTSNKNIIIYFLVGFLLGLIAIFLIVANQNPKEKTVKCDYLIDTENYKVSDEYKINYRKNKITYVESIYSYTAKTDEYKSDVEAVRKEKLPAVVNSNGLKGFTYNYDSSDSEFKVYGWLDFTLFDYDVIDKIDQDKNPISYFKVNSKLDINKLQKDLKKLNYTCNLEK